MSGVMIVGNRPKWDSIEVVGGQESRLQSRSEPAKRALKTEILKVDRSLTRECVDGLWFG